MPDLRELLAAEAHRLEPDSVPAFDDLLTRGRRRRATRAAATVTGVAMAVTAVAGAGWWLAPRPSTTVAISAPIASATTPVADPAVSPEVYASLRALAVALATNSGDPNPTRLEAVEVNPSRPPASRQPSPSSPPLTGGYLLQVQGRFVCGFCKGHAELRATVISQQVSAPGLAVVSTAFGGPWQDLTRYGSPFSLTSAAAPSSPSSPSSPSVSGSPSASGSAADLSDLLQRNFRAGAANTRYRATVFLARSTPTTHRRRSWRQKTGPQVPLRWRTGTGQPGTSA